MSAPVRRHLGELEIGVPGIGLRTIGAAARVYAKLVTDSSVLTARSRPRPRRRAGYDFEVIVTDVVSSADDVRTLLLTRRDGTPLPTWQPGAPIDVTTASGAVRQYSLAGRPAEGDRYRIGVRRIPGGAASGELHALEPGAVLRVRGPRNAFPFAGAEHYLFVAAGIGITPIRAMIERAVRDEKPWTLYYHGRTRSSMPFVADLVRMAAASAGRVIIASDDVDGLPDPAAIVELGTGVSAMYVCGPAGLSSALRENAIRSDVVAEFHTELFAPAPVVDGHPFTLRIGRSGTAVDVGPRETALDAVRRVRPDQPFSCRQGFCGACVVGLVDGRVDHHDRVLGPAERESSIALCVSRAAVDGDTLVLDLQ